jgi:proteic killer suppression protein
LKVFFETGNQAGIDPSHAHKLSAMLRQLDASEGVQDMDLPGWMLHPLQGRLQGHFALRVSGNWRLIFRFDDINAVQVDYRDYH